MTTETTVDWSARYRAASEAMYGCQHGGTLEVSSGRKGAPLRTVCERCWNGYVAERRAIRREQMAARPRCEACATGAGTWHVGAVLMCGRCCRAATRHAHHVVARSGMGLLGAMIYHPTREDLIDGARRERGL